MTDKQQSEKPTDRDEVEKAIEAGVRAYESAVANENCIPGPLWKYVRYQVLPIFDRQREEIERLVALFNETEEAHARAALSEQQREGGKDE